MIYNEIRLFVPPQKAIGMESCHESSDAHGDDTHVCYLCLMCIAQTKAGERWSTCPAVMSGQTG